MKSKARKGFGTGIEGPSEGVIEGVEIEDKLQYPVKAIEQEKPWDCGPTALRIALKFQFGLKLTGDEVITLCGATPAGSDEYNMILALDALGFKYTQAEDGTFNKLKGFLISGQVPLVHLVMDDGGGHYMVLTGYDIQKDTVTLADPYSGKLVTYGIPYFMGVWKIEEVATNTRWYLAITGYSGDKLDALINKCKRIKKKVQKARR